MENVAARRLLVGAFRASVAAADPEAAVAARLEPIDGPLTLLAVGKAAPAMARGAARALGREYLDGIVVSTHHEPIPSGLKLMISSHPVSSQLSLEAGSALLRTASQLGVDDTAVVLISGGGSALAEVPLASLSIEDIAETNRLLLRSGADIEATNTIRRRLSAFKGGGLADAIAPARSITLALSDVVGDQPAAIASGPTVAFADGPGDALRIADELQIGDRLPASIRAALTAERATVEVGPDAEFRIVASGATAAYAAAAFVEAEGVTAAVLDTRLAGESAEAAGVALSRAGRGVSVFAGETTVTVTGDGCGGRNHEAALAAATVIAGRTGIWFLAAGTDGIDGMTSAAGAIVDGGTAARGRAAGFDPALALDLNDSGSFFAGLDEQIVTGPTGTNVGDIWLVLRD